MCRHDVIMNRKCTAYRNAARGGPTRASSGIQRAARTVLGVYLKRTCSRVTSASSALGILNDYTLYKSTHSLTHSLLFIAVNLRDHTWLRTPGRPRSVNQSCIFRVVQAIKSLQDPRSINQSCIFRVVQAIKSLQDPLEVGNNLPGIDDNVRERGLEQKCF